jgi:hypothetical protein
MGTPIEDVDKAMMRRVFDPIWDRKNKTSRLLRGSLEAVIAYAIAEEDRKNPDNPARWRGNLDLLGDLLVTLRDSTPSNLLNQDNISIAAMWAKWIGPGSLATACAAFTLVGVLALAIAAWWRRQAVPRPGARSGVHESELDVPGTYDCEVTSTRDVRCTVFTATSERGLLGRHRALDRIVRRWLPPGWTPVEAAPSPGLLRRLEVSDSIGPRLTLSATRRLQLVFVMHPAPRDPDAILPPERIQFRVTYLDSARAGRGSATTY